MREAQQSERKSKCAIHVTMGDAISICVQPPGVYRLNGGRWRSRDVVMHYISSADMRCIHQRGGQCCSRSQSGPFTVTEVQVPGEEVEGSGTTQGAAQRRRRRRVRDSKPSAEGEASALAAGT